MNRLEEKYRNEVVPSLMEKHNYKTIMLVPKIEKIVVNMGVGDAVANSKNLEAAVADLEKITGLKQIIFTKEVGEESTPIHCSNDRIGFVIAQGESPEAAIEACEKAMKTIKITIE